MSTMENSTSDSSKSTPTTPRSKASSTKAPETEDAAPKPPAAPSDVASLFPARITKLGGFDQAIEAMQVAVEDRKLPSLNPNDYRFILKPPGGLPFAFPVQVVYLPDSPDEVDLGTFRVNR
ncbi:MULTISPECIES: hypothetical protein [Cyanophyceae]|uniref:hypothetical protein n=1 Tax=Cyanophyceae TaxID=3028117 RepID=UPI0016862746|nr:MULTISPECIES: hypothetical protein [Cyanophyceae]MBD1917168.1 hypothetical protein [Phormidium sp. FACHB-77]MBD2030699.1 hypothetical protein [Phormidium sp. FACHB-322]MBD2050193.1 hypothetical protein [Leptolyngbya sp. FACHB-60]